MLTPTTLRLARIAWPVTALGPGQRVVLWVAGCPLRCKACISPELQDPAAGRDIPLRRLADRLLALPIPLDGLTLTGGEPFEQAPALAALWRILVRKRTAWNLLAFSGHPLEQLRQRPEAEALLQHLDLLIDGPYLPDCPVDQPLIASQNQRAHALSTIGRGMLDQLGSDTTRANLGLSQQGDGCLIGILDPQQRQRLHRGLGVE